jgi:hypothetical protein
MAFAGGVYAANSGFIHRNDPEVLLIRVSHWLWKWWRASYRQDRSLEAAIEAMAAVREAYRAPVRASRAERDDRLRQIRVSGGTKVTFRCTATCPVGISASRANP